MKCTVCGFEFKETGQVYVCKGCPLVKNCPLVRCPNCSFEWPKEKQTKKDYISLIDLPPGQKKTIVSFCFAKKDHLIKIVNLGIMPGMEISIIRHSPTILCQVGFSQIAFDDEIAKIILVRR